MKKLIKRISVPLAVAMILLGIAPMTLAHHSFNAHYDASKSVTIEGEVTEFRMENPHARIYLKVKGADEKEIIWLVEMGSRNGMIRNGWAEDELKPGDRVRIVGFPGRLKDDIMHLKTITTLDGVAIGPGDRN